MTLARAVLAVLLLAGGCATSAPPSASSAGAAGHPSRAQCLVDPNETGARPLVFLFCVQSP